MDSSSLDVSKTRLDAFQVTRFGQTQVICSTEDWFTFDTLFYTGCQIANHRSLLPNSPRSLLHCAMPAYKTPGTTRKATEKKAVCIILLPCKPQHVCILSAACISNTIGLTQSDIPYVLAIFSWLYTLQLILCGSTQPFGSLLPNTCSHWQKEKFCLHLTRFSRNQNFSSSCTLVFHSFFLWKN